MMTAATTTFALCRQRDYEYNGGGGNGLCTFVGGCTIIDPTCCLCGEILGGKEEESGRTMRSPTIVSEKSASNLNVKLFPPKNCVEFKCSTLPAKKLRRIE